MEWIKQLVFPIDCIFFGGYTRRIFGIGKRIYFIDRYPIRYSRFSFINTLHQMVKER